MVAKAPLSSDILWVMQLSEAVVPLAWHVGSPSVSSPSLVLRKTTQQGVLSPRSPARSYILSSSSGLAICQQCELGQVT